MRRVLFLAKQVKLMQSAHRRFMLDQTWIDAYGL